MIPAWASRDISVNLSDSMKLAIVFAMVAALLDAAKVDVATLKRNKEAEAFRASASPNQAGSPAVAQAPPMSQPPIVGVWKFNPEKSTARIPPGATEIRQYIMRPDG